MAEYIKREDAIAAFKKRCTFYRGKGFLVSDFDKLFVEDKIVISKIHSADVRENVRGEWLLTLSDVYDFYKCSVCGHEIEAPGGVPTENYCQNCGADMRGSNNGQG